MLFGRFHSLSLAGEALYSHRRFLCTSGHQVPPIDPSVYELTREKLEGVEVAEVSYSISRLARVWNSTTVGLPDDNVPDDFIVDEQSDKSDAMNLVSAWKEPRVIQEPGKDDHGMSRPP